MKHAKWTENPKYVCPEAMSEMFPRLLLIPNQFTLKELKVGDFIALNETEKTNEFVEYSELTWWKITDRANDELLLVRTSVPGLNNIVEEFSDERKEANIKDIVLIRNIYPGVFDRTQFKNTYESTKEPYCMATMKAFNDRHIGIVLKSLELYNKNDTGYELYSGDEYLDTEYMSNSRNLAYFNIDFARVLFPAVKDILINKYNESLSEYKYDKDLGMYIENINKEIVEEMEECTIAEISEEMVEEQEDGVIVDYEFGETETTFEEPEVKSGEQILNEEEDGIIVHEEVEDDNSSEYKQFFFGE